MRPKIANFLRASHNVSCRRVHLQPFTRRIDHLAQAATGALLWGDFFSFLFSFLFSLLFSVVFFSVIFFRLFFFRLFFFRLVFFGYFFLVHLLFTSSDISHPIVPQILHISDSGRLSGIAENESYAVVPQILHMKERKNTLAGCALVSGLCLSLICASVPSYCSYSVSARTTSSCYIESESHPVVPQILHMLHWKWVLRRCPPDPSHQWHMLHWKWVPPRCPPDPSHVTLKIDSKWVLRRCPPGLSCQRSWQWTPGSDSSCRPYAELQAGTLKNMKKHQVHISEILKLVPWKNIK
jgi:hypothetical protein